MLERAQRLEKDAIRIIYLTYQDGIFNLAYRICGDRAMAQDVLQETFILLIDKIQGYRAKGAFAAWLKKIAVNQAIGKLRFDSRFTDDCISEDQSLTSTDLFTNNWVDAAVDLDSLLAQLTETMRIVFWLHEVEGYDHKEIGELFGKSSSFSKVTLHRAYQHLKTLAQAELAGDKNAFNR